MNSQTVTVNLIPGLCTPAVVRVSQYDVGRPILFKVFDGTMPASFESNTIATVVGTKPSGLGFSEVAAISGNTASLNSTLAMTQEAGMIQAEVRFSIQYGPDIGTANFILAVEPSPHPEGTTDGTQETMANLETRLQGQIDDLSDRIDDIEAGGSGLSQTEKNLILTLFSKAAYAESDAGTAYDALENLWTTTTKTITYNLSNVVSSNTQTSIESGQPYSTAFAVRQGYTLNSVTVTMGGVDITSTAYSSGTITIPSVTGNIVITATAVQSQRYVFYDYIYNPTASNPIETSFIDTGLTYSPSWGVLNVEFEAMNSNSNSSSEPLFGSNNETNSDTANILWYARANKAGYSAFNLGVAKQLSTAPADTRCVCKYVFADGGQSYMQYDSTTVNVANVSASSITANNKSLILAGGRALDSNNKRYGLDKDKVKVGYIKFTNPANDEVLYNFVPAHDTEEDKYGYYDTIHNAFYADNSNLYRVGNWS